MTVETEFIKWIILLVTALAIAMLLAGSMAAGSDSPGLLPKDVNDWARPMDQATSATFYPEIGPAPRIDNRVATMWRILELHRQGMAEEAIAAWRDADFGCATEVWRQAAMAVGYLQLGQLEEAADHLDAALEIEPENPVVHYYVGMLRLTQARDAKQWYDMLPHPILLIAMPQIAPNTRDMYELAAMQELEEAINLADRVDPNAPLMPGMWTAEDTPYVPVVTPTVGDLLAALGADRFQVRAHNVLGGLYTEHGLADEAEEHIDAAAAEGMNAPFAYRDLGKLLEAEGRNQDAVRVYLKAFRNGDPNITTVLKIIRNGWQAAEGTE
jgi:tetratricopeptide (TPR) repeat protein